VKTTTRLALALGSYLVIAQPAEAAEESGAPAASSGGTSSADFERVIEGSVQTCARELPMAKAGQSWIHLRIGLRPQGKVGRVSAFDPAREPVPAVILRCVQRASKAWAAPADTGRSAGLTPTLALYPPDVLLVALAGGLTAIHYEDELPLGYRTASWWAVCERPDGGALSPVKLSVNERHCQDDGGREIRVAEGCPKPIFLLKEQAHPSPRPLSIGSIVRAPSGEANTVTFQGKTWRLELAGDDLFLKADGRRQWLLKPPVQTFHPLGKRGDFDRRRSTRIHSPVEFHWAGDLDGDGRLDFLLESSDQKSFDLLFLSSLAHGQEMVHPAALAWRSPCHD
jgi:hypothetical protein